MILVVRFSGLQPLVPGIFSGCTPGFFAYAVLILGVNHHLIKIVHSVGPTSIGSRVLKLTTRRVTNHCTRRDVIGCEGTAGCFIDLFLCVPWSELVVFERTFGFGILLLILLYPLGACNLQTISILSYAFLQRDFRLRGTGNCSLNPTYHLLY